MILRNSHSLKHTVKLESKRQRNHIKNDHDLHRLRRSHRQYPLHFPFKLNNIGKQNHSAGHNKINQKIPVIRKPEHPNHNRSQQNMRHQKLLFPEFLPSRSSNHRLTHTHITHPRIKQSHQKQHKHHIHHMRMQIPENKRITRKLMNRLIRHIRIISNVTRCIREPVAVHFLSLKLLNPRNNLTVDHIMHISRNRNRKSRCQSRCHRHKTPPSSHFLHLIYSRLSKSPLCQPFFPAVSQPVHRHLIDQRKRKTKRKRRHKRTHQIISQLHLTSGQFRQKHRKILTTIIIIDRTFRIPQIPRRKSRTPHHGFHKTIIHKLLRTIRLRPESCKIRPHQEKYKKQNFFPENQIPLTSRKTVNPLLQLKMKQNSTTSRAHHTYTNTRSRRKWQNLHRYQQPGQKPRNRNCQYL